jgi:hypothetical protein
MSDENPSLNTPDVERAIMSMLLDEDSRPWSIQEIQRAIDDPIEAYNAICGLHAHGLINRTSDGMITATRAAIRNGLERVEAAVGTKRPAR